MSLGRYVDCLMCPGAGCAWPTGCSKCGFDRKEAERRKRLPLILCEDRLYRKIIGKKYPDPEDLEGE